MITLRTLFDRTQKPMKTREQVLQENPLELELRNRGVHLEGGGNQRAAKCPFHKDGTASLSVNIAKGAWHCHACKIGGSVIDLIAHFEGRNPAEVYKTLAAKNGDAKASGSSAADRGQAGVRPKLVCTYDYLSETGTLLYQACRMEPKSFRQRRPDPEHPDQWLWNMENQRRVLYNLPKVLAARSPIWVVEGEKDADNLGKLGVIATTNVGGAGKWSEAYGELFVGKEVVLCGDNDEPGKKHIEDVLKSLAGKAKVAYHVAVPLPNKDISDYLATFKSTGEAQAALEKMLEGAAVFEKGIDLPIQSMGDLEREYTISLRKTETNSFDISRWLPSLNKRVRPIVAGEVIVVAADTAVGKTAILQNMAVIARPLITLMFEMELPGTLTFERFAALACGTPTLDVFKSYVRGGTISWRDTGMLSHVYVCQKTFLSPKQIEELIIQSELKIGERPALVMVDYMQLVRGTGASRYERASAAAEELKAIAKSTNTIVVVASQLTRKHGSKEVTLHDAKDSGSIENSAGLLLGAWRDESDPTLLVLKVLKNTKGKPGGIVECNFDGERMLITERKRVSEPSSPTPTTTTATGTTK